MLELSKKEEDRALMAAVKAAQKTAKKFGLEIGGTVAHPSDEFVYNLVDIVGGQIIVERPVNPLDQGGPKIKAKLPLEGAFDPNLAMEGGAYLGTHLKSRKIAKNN